MALDDVLRQDLERPRQIELVGVGGGSEVETLNALDKKKS